MPDDRTFILPTQPFGLARMMPAPLPDSGTFITGVTYSSPDDYPDVCLIQARYCLSRFDESLFGCLDLPAPAHLKRAVSKRRAEYLASRWLVRDTLARFGVHNFLLLNDDQRAPIWPPGFSGSLSHTAESIVLLLTTTDRPLLLGVDCERIMRAQTADAMQEMLITAEEKKVLAESGLPFPTLLTLAFSIKESLYKALFPLLQQFMDFRDAQITHFSPASGEVRLQLTRPLAPDFPAGRGFTGWIGIHETAILSWVIDDLNRSRRCVSQHPVSPARALPPSTR